MLGHLANSQAPLSTYTVTTFVDAQASTSVASSLSLTANATFGAAITGNSSSSSTFDIKRVRTIDDSFDASSTVALDAGRTTEFAYDLITATSTTDLSAAITAVAGGEVESRSQSTTDASYTTNGDPVQMNVTLNITAEAREKWEPVVRKPETWTEV